MNYEHDSEGESIVEGSVRSVMAAPTLFVLASKESHILRAVESRSFRIHLRLREEDLAQALLRARRYNRPTPSMKSFDTIRVVLFVDISEKLFILFKGAYLLQNPASSTTSCMLGL